MTDNAVRVTCSDEQWAWLQFQERQRTQDALETGKAQRAAFTEMLRLMAESLTLQKEPPLSMRDWFAGQALANPALCTGDAPDKMLTKWFGKDATGILQSDVCARQAYNYADAMIAARGASHG